MSKNGFTLIELMIAGAIFSVVALLSFIVLSSSNESAELTTAKSAAQPCLRDTMTALSSELGVAYTERLAGTAAADEDAAPVEVSNDGKSVTFQVPDPSKAWGSHTVPGASEPITIRFENEDANNNTLLDDGEDLNANGTLDRRLVRVQGGEEQPMGGANDISNVTFTLLPNPQQNNMMTRLEVWLEATTHYGADHKKLSAELEAQIRLAN